MKYRQVRTPKWSSAEQVAIDCVVDFEGAPDTPFTAHPADITAHGREIFARAAAGDFGLVAEYVPPPPPTEEQLAARAATDKEAADAQAAREDAAIAAIAAMTPAQAAAYVENNVTNLAEAKAVLKTMAKAICVLARRI